MMYFSNRIHMFVLVTSFVLEETLSGGYEQRIRSTLKGSNTSPKTEEYHPGNPVEKPEKT